MFLESSIFFDTSDDGARQPRLRSFIKGNNEKAKDGDHHLPAHFDMTTYLSQQMTEKLSELIELKVSNW